MGIFKDSSSNHTCPEYSLTESKHRSDPYGEKPASKSGFRCIRSIHWSYVFLSFQQNSIWKLHSISKFRHNCPNVHACHSSQQAQRTSKVSQPSFSPTNHYCSSHLYKMKDHESRLPYTILFNTLLPLHLLPKIRRLHLSMAWSCPGTCVGIFLPSDVRIHIGQPSTTRRVFRGTRGTRQGWWEWKRSRLDLVQGKYLFLLWGRILEC